MTSLDGLAGAGLARLREARRAAGDAIHDLAMVTRLTRDLPKFVRRPLGPDEARRRLHRQIATREQRFLATVDRTVFRQPRSPYLALLRHAGCEPGDLRTLVSQTGVEGALRTLADRGVYVTYEEMKGRREAVRGSLRFAFREASFDNPLARPHIVLHTSGSGGRPGRVGYSLRVIDEWATSMAAVFEAHGTSSPRHVCWWPVPFNWFLMTARLGHPAQAWMYPVHPLPAAVRLAARYVTLVGRLGGYRFPPPIRLDLDRPERLIGWLTDQLRTGEPLLLRTMPSAATRLASAAIRDGHDLRGVTLLSGGEPVTAGRRRQIEASGMRLIVMYASVELNGLAYGCAAPAAVDDVHVMTDRYAVVQRRRSATVGGPTVDALLVTGLNPTAGKVALNAEAGDYAHLEERACDCLLGRLGLRTHLSEIRSFEKLTGEGVAFLRSNLERILEEYLPARFGGTGVDYQFAEEEAPSTRTRLVLRVSPSVGAIDEDALRAFLLHELGRGSLVDRQQAALWRAAGTIGIRREAPLTTRAGKVLPFQSRVRGGSANGLW